MSLIAYCIAASVSFSDGLSYITHVFSEWRIFDIVSTYQQDGWCMMADISKMRVNIESSSEFCHESRSYLVTKATQTLGHLD